MKKQKLFLGLILFVLGVSGIASLLTVELPLPQDMLEALGERFTAAQIRLLVLINPLFLLVVAIIAGLLLHEKTNLQVPLLSGLIRGERNLPTKSVLIFGLAGGMLAGVIIVLLEMSFRPQLPDEFIQLGENLKLSLAARFLYGGLTEEILMRFGLMTLFVWLASKVFRGLNSPAYWIGIIFSTLLFAVGHFPAVISAVGSPSTLLLAYIIIGNSVGGVIFGWLYWKKGLESAFVAHIFAHVVMVLF
jgi:hypothetical protein